MAAARIGVAGTAGGFGEGALCEVPAAGPAGGSSLEHATICIESAKRIGRAGRRMGAA
jgi:hypothetical protein